MTNEQIAKQLECDLMREMGISLKVKVTRTNECDSCDGTGDIHRADGEYLGKCNCSEANHD